jgi:general secretion pathway protein H
MEALSVAKRRVRWFSLLPITDRKKDHRSMRRDDGFTLIEVLVVLAIVGVVLGVLIGRGPDRSRGLEARAAAGALAQTLRAARAQAIAADHDVTVAFDSARHSFAADGGPIRLVNPGIDMSVLPPSLPGPGATRLIRFSADGSSTGGEVLLGTGGRKLDISVEWLTGKVSVADAH